MEKELFELKVNAKVASYAINPESMLTENMTGKMANCKAFTTSCANNSTCQKRIAAALELVKNHSDAAALALADYMAPSTQKRHITQKELVKKLELLDCPIPVCMFCYAQKSLTGYRGDAQNIKFTANLRFLTACERDYNELPIITGFRGNDGNLYERLESHGDTENETQAINYTKTVIANSRVNFTVWTKNPAHYYKAFLKYGKPSNLKVILSSYLVNKPDIDTAIYYNSLFPGMVDSVFTVWTENGAKKAGIVLNCCGQTDAAGRPITRHCHDCMNCYYRNGAKNKLVFAQDPTIAAVNEILR